jgi:anthranilate phosphoribosyltransferase
MKHILQHLFDHQRLDRSEARQILIDISHDQYSPEQIASFLTVFLMRPISVEELQGFREALLELCRPIDLKGIPAIDIVGTGGDGKNTFNISTLAAFVIAGAGYPVLKHGNYSVSSHCGSSNVLEALGYTFQREEDALLQQLENSGIAFLHAPLFHPAMKTVAPIRRSLGVKTFFNILGPLVNPAQPPYQVFGVFDRSLARLYQYVLQDLDKDFTVVYALDGYDEVSLTGPVQLNTSRGAQRIDPIDFGLPVYDPSALFGGNDVPEAAAIFLNVLENEGTSAQRDVVIANAALGIQTIAPDRSLIDCVAEARESLNSGKALQVLRSLIAS